MDKNFLKYCKNYSILTITSKSMYLHIPTIVLVLKKNSKLSTLILFIS